MKALEIGSFSLTSKMKYAQMGNCAELVKEELLQDLKKRT